MRQKDTAHLVEMVTEDVLFLPPGFPPIRGKPAVQTMYQSFFPQFSSVDLRASLEEVEVGGDWAFAWGLETFVLVPNSGAPAIHMRGKGMTILRRQPDGSWKFARGINNTFPVTT